jgi:tryptophanyl-tRNA synthetase
VELARNIAERFNHLYGPTFIVPEPVIPKMGARIMGLDNPNVKMSKSYAHIRGHAIRLIDPPEEIERSFKRAVTDPGNEIRFSEEPERAGVNNLLTIYKVVTGKSQEEVEGDFVDARGYGDLKKRVAEVVIEELKPLQSRYNQIMADPAFLGQVLRDGAERAAAVAAPKVGEMMQKMGLVGR